MSPESLSALALSVRVAAVMEKLRVVSLGDRPPRERSGGQRQRVALGRALAIEPALLLLDEPLSALDVPARRALRDELQATLAAWNIPAVLVTHDFSEAYQLGDRVVIYEAGRVRQAGSRGELLWRPLGVGGANPRVLQCPPWAGGRGAPGGPPRRVERPAPRGARSAGSRT